MPLPYHGFVVSSGGSDANDGLDPHGTNISTGYYDDVGHTNGDHYLYVSSGTPFSALQSGDYLAITSGTNMTAGLYEVAAVHGSGAGVTLRESAGTDSLSAGDINTSDGPRATISSVLGLLSTTGDCVVVCADGTHTLSSTITLTGTGGQYGYHIRGGNARGVVDGTQATISGGGTVGPLFQMLIAGVDYRNWYDIRFTDSDEDGIYTSQVCDGWSFTRCRFDNNDAQGVGSRASYSWRFEDCRFDNNGQDATESYRHGCGIQSNGTGQGGGLFMRCVFHDNDDIGLKMNASGQVIDCISYDNGGHGMEWYRNFATASGPSVIEGSIFFRNGGSGLNVTSWVSSGPMGSVRNSVFANNTSYGIDADTGANGASPMDVDYCVFHGNTAGKWNNVPQNGRIGSPGADHNLWIEFQNGTYQDTGHADGNYRLQATGAFADLPYNTTGLVNIVDGTSMTTGIHIIASKISDDAVLLSASAGSGTQTDVDADTDPGFTNESAGSEDFTPASGSILIDRAIEVASA